MSKTIQITNNKAWKLSQTEGKNPPYPGYGFNLKNGDWIFCHPKDKKFYIKKYEMPEESQAEMTINEIDVDSGL